MSNDSDEKVEAEQSKKWVSIDTWKRNLRGDLEDNPASKFFEIDSLESLALTIYKERSLNKISVPVGEQGIRQSYAGLLSVLGKGADHFYELKSKKGRELKIPQSELKQIQRKLFAEHSFLRDAILNEMSATGYYFRLGRSNWSGTQGLSEIDYVLPHKASNYQLSFDLKNAFGQIGPDFLKERMFKGQEILRLFSCFITAAKDLEAVEGKEEDYYQRWIENEDNFAGRELPQGAPHSSLVFDFCLLPLDEELIRLARKYRFKVTRFADNIFISSKHPFRDKVRSKVQSTVEKRFELNPVQSFGKKSEARPLRMLGLNIMPQAKIRFPPQKSDRFRARLNDAVMAMKCHPRRNKTVKKVKRADGTLGYIAELYRKEHGDLRFSLVNQVKEYQEVRSDYSFGLVEETKGERSIEEKVGQHQLELPFKNFEKDQ